ncbi:MAG: T9SS type A sorting domain-containing protein [Williamsia sp.]|nr:T9SS type A sorting domain-containing protein [Williamsia sp.]
MIRSLPTLLRVCIACCAFFLLPFLSSAAIIYVNPAASGANNGTSWTNAYTSLSTALLAAASGDEVWVKQGVYKPSTLVDVNTSGGTEAREATFQIPNGVALYGGFTGSELTRDARNPAVNLTILSGDLDNNDVNTDGNQIAESTADVVGNNAYHVLYTVNVNAATRVDGFVVTAGKAMSTAAITDANQDGGAWYNKLSGAANASSPGIANTVFQGNYAASEGGAIFNTNGPAGGAVLSLIERCKFMGNKSNIAGGAINLGSFSAGNYQPHFVGCEFTGNEAARRGGALYMIGDHALIDSSFFRNNKVTAVSPDNSTFPGSGGAVGMVASNAAFKQCMFEGNTSTGNPTGAFEGGGGGAVYMSSNEPQTTTLGPSAPSFIGCGFYTNTATGNTTAWGGAAVHLSDGGKLRPRYVNCVFSGNQAHDNGGAVASFARVMSVASGYTPDLNPDFTNCTFTANHAGTTGGALYFDGYVYLGAEVLHGRVENTIIWNNTATASGPAISFTGNNVVAYSDVQGSGGSGGGWNSSLGTDGGNNLDANPGFTDAANPKGADGLPATTDDGLRLTTSAAPVDAGNGAATGLAGIATDYIRASRVQGSRVDMGAYEQAKISAPPVKIYWLKDWDLKPVCLSCPWAFIFTENLSQQFIWDGPAQLIDQDDRAGTALITGHIVNRKNKKQGFDVHLKLVNKQDWAAWSSKGRTYTTFGLQAFLTGLREHRSWTFWELSDESYLNGTDDISGKLGLAPAPANYKTGFQLGEGANGWDDDFGMSGTFSYKGVITIKGKKSSLSGLGTMNVDAELCKDRTCTPLTERIQSASTGMLQAQEEGAGMPHVNLYPVPARNQLTISGSKLPAGMYTIRFYDAKGQLRKEERRYGSNGNFATSVKELQPGLYILQLYSNTGVVSTQKFLVE